MTGLRDKRMRVWGHNQLFGHVAMAKRHMLNIASADTASREAQQIAFTIYYTLCDLYEALQTRIDP